MGETSTARRACAPRSRRLAIAALGLGLPLAACGGGPLAIYELNPARPPPARPLAASVRIAEPIAGLALDSDRIVVRAGSEEMAALAGAKWPDRLPLMVQARLAQSFQNAGLAPQVSSNPAAAAAYELDLDIRKFDLDAARAKVEIDIAAKLVAASGGVAAAEIFTADAPVGSSDPATVAAAMDGALTSVMKRIVAFVAAKL